MNVTKDKISLRPQTTFSACRQGASRSLLCFPSEKTEDAPLLYDPPAGRQVSTSTRSARRWCTHPSATPRRPHRQLRARMAFRGNEAFDFGDILAEVDNGEVTADSSSPEHDTNHQERGRRPHTRCEYAEPREDRGCSRARGRRLDAPALWSG